MRIASCSFVASSAVRVSPGAEQPVPLRPFRVDLAAASAAGGPGQDLEVIAQAASGTEAVAMARRHRPDVAVLDLQMPGLDGSAVAEELRSELPDCASLIVTSHGRPVARTPG